MNRQLAILGASEQCIATHPPDMCVALPELDTTLQPGELVTHITRAENTMTAALA